MDAQHYTGADTRCGALQPEARIDAGEKHCGSADLYQVMVPP